MPDPPYTSIPPELLEALLDNPHESLILVDAQGIVRYITTSNESFVPLLEMRPLVATYRNSTPTVSYPGFSRPGEPKSVNCSGFEAKNV